MGNKTNSPLPNSRCAVDHPVLSCGYVFNSGSNSYIEVNLPNLPVQTLQIWKKNIQQYKIKLKDHQCIYLPISFREQSQNLCGQSRIIKVRYSYPLLLSEELENRIQIFQPFSEQQILYLSYIMLYSAEKIHAKNAIIGDIRPKNIFLFQDGQIQLSSLGSFEDEQTSFQKFLNQGESTFLSPQQSRNILQNIIDQRVQDAQKSEMFSIGVTLLSLVLLHKGQDLYKSEKRTLKKSLLMKQLSILVKCSTYSEFLKKLIIGLLCWQPQYRLRADEVIQILKQEEDHILQLESIDWKKMLTRADKLQKWRCIQLSKYKDEQVSGWGLIGLNYLEEVIDTLKLEGGQVGWNQEEILKEEKRYELFKSKSQKFNEPKVQNLHIKSVEAMSPYREYTDHQGQVENQKNSVYNESDVVPYDGSSSNVKNNYEMMKKVNNNRPGTQFQKKAQMPQVYFTFAPKNTSETINPINLNLVSTQKSQQKSEDWADDGFANYESIIHKIDQQLRESRKKFPQV